MLTEINYETLPSFYLGFEKEPKKIAEIMDIDEQLVYKILNKIQGENNANVR